MIGHSCLNINETDSNALFNEGFLWDNEEWRMAEKKEEVLPKNRSERHALPLCIKIHEPGDAVVPMIAHVRRSVPNPGVYLHIPGLLMSS
jgi:hypothetical protein